MREAPEGVIDHVEIPVSHFERARAFYCEALGQLGLGEIISVKAAEGKAWRAGFGRDGYPRLWLIGPRKTGAPVHLALRVPSRESVDAFHAHALRSGGRDMALPESAAATTTTIMQLTCWIPMGTISRQCAKRLSRRRWPLRDDNYLTPHQQNIWRIIIPK